jgi:transcriptional regulator with XRE-family HTH domain
MVYDNIAYGAEVRRRRLEKRLKVGDLAASLGVDELALSRVERGEEPSQSVREGVLCQLGISYAAYGKAEFKPNLNEAMEITARADVLPFPYRYRVQDDV